MKITYKILLIGILQHGGSLYADSHFQNFLDNFFIKNGELHTFLDPSKFSKIEIAKIKETFFDNSDPSLPLYYDIEEIHLNDESTNSLSTLLPSILTHDEEDNISFSILKDREIPVTLYSLAVVEKNIKTDPSE